METLEAEFGLVLNKSKSYFLSDNPSHKTLQDICGIARAEKVKYLGMQLELSRPGILKSVESSVKKNLGSFKSRISIKDPKV